MKTYNVVFSARFQVWFSVVADGPTAGEFRTLRAADDKAIALNWPNG